MMTNQGNRVTQGQFSYLRDLTDAQIGKQIDYALSNGWSIGVEYTDDPHPRNVYWEMWGLPMFDLDEPDGVLTEIDDCRSTFPNYYIRVIAYDAGRGRQTTALQFLVHRPANEPGFLLTRTEGADRRQSYGLSSYATTTPTGERYGQE